MGIFLIFLPGNNADQRRRLIADHEDQCRHQPGQSMFRPRQNALDELCGGLQLHQSYPRPAGRDDVQ